MPRTSVSQKDIHSMDMGLKSTGFMQVSEVEIDPMINLGVSSFIPHIDVLFGKLIPGQVIAVTGSKGAGKSTFFMGLLDIISYGAPDDVEISLEDGICDESKTCGYISAEERIDFLKIRAERIGASNLLLANESSIEKICDMIRDNDLDVVVVDSLQSLYSDLIDGETKTIKYAGNKLVQVAKETNTILIVICHATVTGAIKGGTKFPHQCDTELHIQRVGHDLRHIYTEKNRMGRTGNIYLNMDDGGYDYYTLLELDDSEDEESSEPSTSKSKSLRVKHTESLVDAITNSSGGFDMQELSNLCKSESIDLIRAESILRDLVSLGQIKRTGTRRNNFKWFANE